MLRSESAATSVSMVSSSPLSHGSTTVHREGSDIQKHFSASGGGRHLGGRKLNVRSTEGKAQLKKMVASPKLQKKEAFSQFPFITSRHEDFGFI